MTAPNESPVQMGEGSADELAPLSLARVEEGLARHGYAYVEDEAHPEILRARFDDYRFQFMLTGEERGVLQTRGRWNHTVDVSRLRRKKGFLPRQIMNEIDSALMFSLSIGTETRTNTMFRKWESHIKEHGIDMAEEISAMSVRTTDQRVDALTRALQLIAAERDAYKTLYESAGALPEVLDSAHALLESAENSLQTTRSHDERRTAG